MRKEWFFDRFCGAKIAVYAEDGQIVEIEIAVEGGGETVGNIYKGKVSNVVPGMRAAFVSCGMEKNCYLPFNETNERFLSYDGESGGARLSVREGEELLVQVVQPARGSKGAKVTADLAFVGRSLIFLPQTEFLGISRKITDEKLRETLLKTAESLKNEGEGFIVRTAAQSANKRQLKAEANYLRKIYASVCEAAKSAPAGTAVYTECGLPDRVMRDALGSGIDKIYVGDEEMHGRILHFARMSSDLGEKLVVLHTGERDMLTEYGFMGQIEALTERRCDLENGGYLIIDGTEAMTVIDVNTGKFTGESDLESTVFETNLLAAREIARQVRLRNIGGIVTIDFIDMAQEEHRRAVDERLTLALEDDRSKCRVYPMNELCVSMFTRKRTKHEVTQYLLKPCSHCTREGYVHSNGYMSMRIRGAVMDCFADGYESVIVELNAKLMKQILAGKYLSPETRGAWSKKRVYFVPHIDWNEEKFSVRGDNNKTLTLPDNAQILY